MLNMTSFIWDLDGTLLNSYPLIVNSLYTIYSEKGVLIDKKEIYKQVIEESVSAFIKAMEAKFNIPFEDLKERYNNITHKELNTITPMEHSKEILEYLNNIGIDNYVYTHRGTTTEVVLSNIGLISYFKDIITSLDNFKRKPDPEGLNYLINKYNLDRNNTYYVGDRKLDIECANNAHIKSIMFIEPSSPGKPTGKEDHVIRDLLEIKDILERQNND